MLTRPVIQKWFLVRNPNALVSRRDAVNLILRHANKVRVFEDLSDARIDAELQKAWQREHDQVDMFRDVLPEPANDDHHPPPWFRNFWNWLH